MPSLKLLVPVADDLRYATRVYFPLYPALRLRLRADFMTTSAPRPEYIEVQDQGSGERSRRDVDYRL